MFEFAKSHWRCLRGSDVLDVHQGDQTCDGSGSVDKGDRQALKQDEAAICQGDPFGANEDGPALFKAQVHHFQGSGRKGFSLGVIIWFGRDLPERLAGDLAAKQLGQTASVKFVAQIKGIGLDPEDNKGLEIFRKEQIVKPGCKRHRTTAFQT